jgi:hypothetical protein
MSKFLATVISVLCAAVLFAAQQETPQPPSPPSPEAAKSPEWQVPEGGMPTYIRTETPEQRKARLGTPVDPGINPDPNTKWGRFGTVYTIKRYERRNAAYDRDPGTVRPLVLVNFEYEIYQHNEKYVWVWMPEMPTAAQIAEKAAEPQSTMTEATENYWRSVRPQFNALTPPPANKTIRFEESSEGLPNGGSWRNSLTVADMNEDGFLDIIAPPQRGGQSTTFPSIFLGDGKGHWRYWADVSWPRSIDYGSVVAADFNRDGHQDLAFGVHLRGVFLFLGDGKGHFTSIDAGLPRNFPSRRVVVEDVDRDGYPDIVAASEGPTNLATSRGGKLKAFLNRDKGEKWEEIDIADPTLRIGGDWLTAADLNGDSRPDFVIASVFQGNNQIVHLSEGKNKWKHFFSANDDIIPLGSSYSANAAGYFSSKKRADAIISYSRTWDPAIDERKIPTPPLTAVASIDRLTWTDKGLKREPIARWTGTKSASGMAVGDFDGDGNQDIIFTRLEPRDIRILLGDGKGGFTEAGVEGLTMQMNSNYDVKVADVNADGRPDVILMYETGGQTALSDRDGAIRVFLGRGAVAKTATRE